MAIDTTTGSAAEQQVITAIKNGLLTIYADKGPQPAEMEKLARAITPGILTALQLVNDNKAE
jgi:hypothetical protein